MGVLCGAMVIRKFFRPQTDITAYETAFILAHLSVAAWRPLWKQEVVFTLRQWEEEMPKEMRRHFNDAR